VMGPLECLGTKEKRDFIAHKERERWGGGLSMQADRLAGARRKEKALACSFRNDGEGGRE
jgi:hypothetical protein